MATYTVKAGDTLYAIANKYNVTVENLVKWNDIGNKNLIYVGQVLQLSGSSSGGSGGSSTTTTTTSSNAATIKHFGLQSDTDRTIFATWVWDKKNTENYKAMWYYDTGDGVWFVGSNSTVEEKQSTYNAPTNAKRVKFIVRPISKTYTSNNKEVHYWTASNSTAKIYDFDNAPPLKPSSAPTVKIEKYKLTAELDNLDLNATEIEFHVVQDNTKTLSKGKATIKAKYAAYSCTVTAGSVYKVRCRAVRGTLYSDWTDFSSNLGTIPSAPSTIISLRALTETSVNIDWENVKNATSYEVQYTNNKSYFNSNPNEVKSMTVESVVGHAEVTGLTLGEEWFFRVRAVNAQGSSAWTPIASIALGKPPTSPTTWSSASTIMVGEVLFLYWTHNAEDGSKPTYAEVETYIDGVKDVITLPASKLDYTSFTEIDTSEYPEGTKIQWRVRTAGVTKEYGDWSIQRTITVYIPPTMGIDVTDVNGNSIDMVETFPFYVSGTTSPNTQTPIGYHVSVIAKESYDDLDNTGVLRTINVNDSIYTRFFDTDEELLIEFTPDNISLKNNIKYTVVCVVSMDTGLTAEAKVSFTVALINERVDPNASISIDRDNLIAHIRPNCDDIDGVPMDGFDLSVYRRELDGTFTEIATGLDSAKNTFVTDPHPALDYARYRIVAKSHEAGTISYYDVPAYPVGEKSIVFQWGEQWFDFDVINMDLMEEQPWSGTLLKFQYNVDISESNDPDVELVNYIGRKHSVSYYGTHVGSTANWNASIPKDDTQTIQALRRLSEWMGDVYVREPSGSGYWANVKVSFNQTHCETSIPVSFDITRVEGGI